MALIGARSIWEPRWAAENYSVPMADDVAIHHSVTDTLSERASIQAEIAEMRELEKIGHTRFGYTISYNVVVFPSGRAYQGCPFNLRGQHTGGHNSTVRSICFAGNYEENEPTQAQLNTARKIIAEGRGKWWRRDADVNGHRKYAQTACPGKNVQKHLDYLSSGTVTPTTTKRKPERVIVNVSMPVVDLRNADEKPVRGRAVHLVQTLLVFAGYNIGRAGIDGVGGPMTRVALGNFQIDTRTGTGGKADWVVGEKSWKELIGGWQG